MPALDTRPVFATHRRGSALITVALVSSIILLLIGSLLSYALSERRLNIRHIARIEARNAAEALAEYGAAQIRQKYETRGSFLLNPNGTDALRQPPSSFWTGSNVVSTVSDLSSSSAPPTASLNLELIGGTERQIKTGTSDLYFVNPADENNAKDPLVGKWVTRRDVSVIARASVRPALGAPITAYVGQTISVRGAPLFAHAIFYNMDLEIFNGPAMTISGPVHTNGNLYLFPDTGALTFKGNVTATGKIYHAGKPGDTKDGAGGANRTAAVNFLNKAGADVALKGKDVTSASSTTDFWRDSTGGTGTSGSSFANFAANASQVWNGSLLTGEHGIQNYTPVAIGKYVEDPTPSNGVDNSVNTGRLIIEPPALPVSSDPAYDKKMEIEKQKYANMAGIYITVAPTTGAITVASRGIASDKTLKTVKTLTLPTNNALVKLNPYTEISTKTTTAKTYTLEDNNSSGSAKRYRIITTTTTSNYTNTTANTTAGTLATTTALTGTPASSSSNGSWSSNNTAPSVPSATSSDVTTTPTVTKGMYDQHRAKGIDLVDIDMNALRDVVTEMKKTTGVPQDPTKAMGGLTTTDWNGIVYVDVLGGPTTRITDESTSLLAGSTIAPTNLANATTAVRLKNGTGKVPSYGTDNPGLTIATNAPVYILGNYNSDGNTTTSGVNSATDPETGEVPAAIAADAITVLSSGFSDPTSHSALSPAASADTEVAAAFLTGIAPTNKNNNGQTSGGAHNLVRFLENWGGKKTWFRGSLVCLFESRVFTEPHGSGYYGAPDRNWGFNKLFSQGIYPPGTPKVLSYRRVDFTDMSSAEYATIRDSFNWW